MTCRTNSKEPTKLPTKTGDVVLLYQNTVSKPVAFAELSSNSSRPTHLIVTDPRLPRESINSFTAAFHSPHHVHLLRFGVPSASIVLHLKLPLSRHAAARHHRVKLCRGERARARAGVVDKWVSQACRCSVLVSLCRACLRRVDCLFGTCVTSSSFVRRNATQHATTASKSFIAFCISLFVFALRFSGAVSSNPSVILSPKVSTVLYGVKR